MPCEGKASEDKGTIIWNQNQPRVVLSEPAVIVFETVKASILLHLVSWLSATRLHKHKVTKRSSVQD